MFSNCYTPFEHSSSVLCTPIFSQIDVPPLEVEGGEVYTGLTVSAPVVWNTAWACWPLSNLCWAYREEIKSSAVVPLLCDPRGRIRKLVLHQGGILH